MASRFLDSLRLTLSNAGPPHSFVTFIKTRAFLNRIPEDADSIDQISAGLSFAKRSSTINVVVCGETEDERSSVINLIAQKNITATSSNIDECTMQSIRYDVQFDGLNYALFDTAGMDYWSFGVDDYLETVERAYKLILSLQIAGGIHLLVFCIRGGRIPGATQSNYRLFAEGLCSVKVPIALVFTDLEEEQELEDFWMRNKFDIERFGFKSSGHRCIVAVKRDIPGGDLKFMESQAKIRELLKDYALKDIIYSVSVHYWLARILRVMKNITMRHASPPNRRIMKVLTQRCNLDFGTAQKIVCMIEKVESETTYVEGGSHNLGTGTEVDFRRCYIKKMKKLGDSAMHSGYHEEAIVCFANILSINPTSIEIIVKCCWVRSCFLQDELVSATMAIKLEPSDYKGYKRKHAILHAMGRYKEAFEAFEMMLSSMDQSRDPQIQKIRGKYFNSTPLIHEVVEQTVRDIPRVLIDVTTGRLVSKVEQTAAFKQSGMFHELRASMITRDRLDCSRIRREVAAFYRYVMLSHRWQMGEPTFQMVENISIYGLLKSPTTHKLISFCRLVRSCCFRWAWSDTCCVNQADRSIQQESVVAMFRWYNGSSLTVVHLLGVSSKSQRTGSLWKSIWNTRGWTYQEYVASKVVQFYTEDWKPYLDLELFNHKESPTILSEMEQATNFAHLETLRPGLERVREKLYLASKRHTTREEDIAYSLFGIFNVAIPVIYGEGKQAVGRLLEHILTRSDNVTVLAWTGISGDLHSYLPSDLTMYEKIHPPHIPLPMEEAEMDMRARALQSSLGYSTLPTMLYQQLYGLPPLSLIAGRLRLSGLVFPLADVVFEAHDRGTSSSNPVYCATTPNIGRVLIQTTENLLGMDGLLLVHPWISPLIDQDFSGGTSHIDLTMRALRLVVRLRQPFGAL